MALLEVKHLHTFFKTRKGIVKAVNDVSYSLESGRTIGIVGESGSGKSVSAMSILRLLDGNGYIDSGEVIFEGQDLTKLKIDELYKIRGDKISVIFQEPMTSLNPVFTLKVVHKTKNLRLNGYVQCRRGFICDENFRSARKSHSYHDALAHSARKLVRILSCNRFGVRNLNGFEHFYNFLLGLFFLHSAVDDKRLRNLLFYRENGI